MDKVTFPLICAIALVALPFSIATVESNPDFIDMILSKLNNREACKLPAYKDIDQVARIFKNMQENSGLQDEAFKTQLADDQRLLLATILDQWDSFQTYMNFENVIKRAKMNAYLSKVVDYQTKKYGESICKNNPSSVLDDPVYEKNPLVRYGQHFSGQTATKNVAGHVAKNEDGTDSAHQLSEKSLELKFKVHERNATGRIQSSKQYATKLKFDSSHPQNRITLHFDSIK